VGWSIGYDDNWKRDIGYGVPARCDHPKCNARIDRGLAYVCGGEPYGGEKGCGLYFCANHLSFLHGPQRCPRCNAYKAPYKRPKPDMRRWVVWKLRHKSWQRWRDENPGEVAKLRALVAGRGRSA
jgi:hypothetical protein